MANKNEFDFVIVGGGVTGLAAAMYGARLGLKSVVFGASNSSELPIGGVITTTNIVENYPGFIRLSGTELSEKIKEHALSYKEVELRQEKVENISGRAGKFRVKTNKGEYFGKTILIATGTKWKKLEVPGSLELENKGVAYCALCDAPLFKNKIVAVVGGRTDKIKPEPVNLKRVEMNKKIEVIAKTNVVEVLGKEFVTGVRLDRAYKGSNELKLDGVFVAIGHVFLSGLANDLGVKLNEAGEIIIDHKTSETNAAGVFAAGDVADKPFKQAITGVAEGCTAAYSAYQFITKNHVETS